MSQKNRKKVQNFHVMKCWMFSFEGWRLLLWLVIFFNFRSSNPGSGSGIRIRNYKKCWIRIRIRIRIKSMRIRNPGHFDPWIRDPESGWVKIQDPDPGWTSRISLYFGAFFYPNGKKFRNVSFVIPWNKKRKEPHVFLAIVIGTEWHPPSHQLSQKRRVLKVVFFVLVWYYSPWFWYKVPENTE